ncbi:MAG: hypothetical protein KGL57_07670 [Burkholderiales bacterium]|nr:hypothetical protein [Burkholderiales bacterium]
MLESVVDAEVLVLSNHDLHLARLRDALPYDGAFTPLVEDIRGVLTDNHRYDGVDLLSSGYGQVIGGSRVLQVGWSPLFSSFPTDVSPANPHLAAYPTPTDGDSGGAVFAVTQKYPQGALVGVMRAPAPGLDATWGFGTEVRQKIEAVLSNPALNPSGERISWISASDVVGVAAGPRTAVPYFKNEGTFGFDTGLVTSTYPGTLQIHIPTVSFPPTASSEGVLQQYRVRLLHESHLNAAITSFDYLGTKAVLNQDWTIGSGIAPGKWYMTVSTVVSDPIEGTAEGPANRRIEFSIPQSNQWPRSLASVSLNFTDLDFGDGQRHWCVDITPVAGMGPVPEGVLWSVFGKTWRMTMNESGALCDTWDPSGLGNTPGKEFQVVARPYIGAALGPVTNVKVVAP